VGNAPPATRCSLVVQIRRDFAESFERGFEVFDDFPSGDALVEEEKVTRQ
jgi:hypothetical protein